MDYDDRAEYHRRYLNLRQSQFERSPVTFASVTVILADVALASNWLPARRAARVDPIPTLRAE